METVSWLNVQRHQSEGVGGVVDIGDAHQFDNGVIGADRRFHVVVRRNEVFVTVEAEVPDFTLFRLIPNGGLYVRGFGQAFEVSADMKNSEHVVGDRIGMKTD